MNRLLASLQDAASFLTVLPFSCPLGRGDSTHRMDRAVAWFPLVGAGIGAVAAGLVLWTGRWLPGPVAAILGVVLLVGLTGGLHLDGFTDTVDGLLAWKGPEETLRIMRDSRVGSLGAAALVLILGLKWACVYTLPSHRLLAGLVSCCALSRWAMVLSARIFRYVPGKTGLGRLVTEAHLPTAFWGATLLTIGIVLAGLGPLRGISSLALAAGMMWGLNRWFVARLGGITGDTLGAVSELVEVTLLLSLFVP